MEEGSDQSLAPRRRAGGHHWWQSALAALLPPRPQELLLAACLLEKERAAVAWDAFVRAVRDPKLYFERNDSGLKGLLPFVALRLLANGIPADNAFSTYARVALVREEQRNRIIGSVLSELLRTLETRDIQPVLIKGAALAATVYPEPWARHVHAIDLLIDAADWRTLRELLPKLRFTAGSNGPDAEHHQTYRHWTGLALGVHSRAFYLPYFELPRAAVERRTTKLDLQGVAVRTLSPEDSLVHLCGHAMYARSRPNQRWVCDAVLLIRKYSRLDWSLVADTAEEARTLPALSVQLDWLAQTFCPIPAASTVGMRQRATRVAAANREAIFVSLLHTTQSRRRTLAALSGALRAQLQFLRFSLMPSSRYMRWNCNASSAWRLAMAYADRPRRLALRIARLGGRPSLPPSTLAAWHEPMSTAVASGEPDFLTPEFELLCLTARVEFSSQAAIRATLLATSGQLNWSAFLAQVERNYVAPVVHRNLSSMSGAVPAKVLDTLRVRAKITAFRSEQFATELVRLIRLFDACAIRTIHYKGAVTAHEFYGSVALRTYNDLDFLVDPAELRSVVRILEAQGYENAERLTDRQFVHYVREFKEFLFRRQDILLEPHWSLAGRRYPFDPDYDGFWRRSRALNLRGTDVRVLSLEDSLLVLCLVGAKGRWKRLQMIVDIAAGTKLLTEEDWQRLQARASATGTVRILHVGLLLAQRLSGALLPAPIARQLTADSAAAHLARKVTANLMRGQQKPRWLPDTPSIFSRLLFAQRVRLCDRLTYLWYTTTTPDLLHLRRIPLPGFAQPLYRMLVPLHDLVLYPAWQVGRTLMRAPHRWLVRGKPRLAA